MQLQLRLRKCVEIFGLVSVQLHPKKAKNWTGPDFRTLFVSDEDSLPLVSFFDLNIVISRPNIYLGEDRCSLQLVNEVGDQGKGVCIFDSMFVQVAIVLTRVERAILLSYKEERGCLG